MADTSYERAQLAHLRMQEIQTLAARPGITPAEIRALREEGEVILAGLREIRRQQLIGDMERKERPRRIRLLDKIACLRRDEPMFWQFRARRAERALVKLDASDQSASIDSSERD